MSAQMGLRNFLTQISNHRGWPSRDLNNGTFAIEIVLPSRRTQVVYSMLGRDPDGVEIVYFWSNACPLSVCRDAFGLLAESTQLSHAAYATKDGNLIVKTSRVAQYLNIEELARVLFYVGKYADELEARLLGHHFDQN